MSKPIPIIDDDIETIARKGSQSVKQSKRKEEAYTLLAEGTYRATIIDMTFRDTISDRHYGSLCVALSFEGIPIFSYMPGFSQIIHMVLATKDLYIGKEVDVKIKHRAYNERMLLDPTIKWETFNVRDHKNPNLDS